MAEFLSGISDKFHRRKRVLDNSSTDDLLKTFVRYTAFSIPFEGRSSAIKFILKHEFPNL